MSAEAKRTQLDLSFGPGVAPERHAEVRKVLEELDYFASTAACQVENLPGGGTNMNLMVEHEGDRYVLRLAEQDVERFAIDRDAGIEAHLRLAEVGVAPELCAWLANGHSLTRFVEGPIIDEENILEPGMIELVARTLRRVHESEPIGAAGTCFDHQHLFARIAREEAETMPADFEQLMAKCDAFEAVFAELKVEPRLCHNDIQLQNMVIGADQLWVLDFEYAAMGDPLLDLAMIAVNADLDEAGEDRLLGAYFGEVRERDRARIRLWAFVSAMRDATWALFAGKADELGFDYDAWAAQFFGRARAFAFSPDFDACLDAVRKGA